MKFVPEDFKFSADSAGDEDTQAARIANEKMALILQRLEAADRALRICAKFTSPSANTYVERYKDEIRS